MDNHDIFIYTHAPTTFKHIELLSEEFNTIFDSHNQTSLFRSLSNINEAFQYLLLSEEILPFLEHFSELFDFIWRREYQAFSIYPL